MGLHWIVEIMYTYTLSKMYCLEASLYWTVHWSINGTLLVYGWTSQLSSTEGSSTFKWKSSDTLFGNSWCVVRDGRCSSSSGFTQKKCYFTVLRHIFFFWLVKLSFKLTNIICVIRGTIQTGSKDNLSLAIDFNTYFFRNKVPWSSPGKGGTSPLYGTALIFGH